MHPIPTWYLKSFVPRNRLFFNMRNRCIDMKARDHVMTKQDEIWIGLARWHIKLSKGQEYTSSYMKINGRNIPPRSSATATFITSLYVRGRLTRIDEIECITIAFPITAAKLKTVKQIHRKYLDTSGSTYCWTRCSTLEFLVAFVMLGIFTNWMSSCGDVFFISTLEPIRNYQFKFTEIYFTLVFWFRQTELAAWITMLPTAERRFKNLFLLVIMNILLLL